METVNLKARSTELAQDLAVATAILARAPYWPRWERLSDAEALIRVEESAPLGGLSWTAGGAL